MHRPRLPVFARLVLFPLPVFLLAQVPAATATLWRVPEDLPHIQDAIAAAEDGDQVVVSPGTYHEVLDFLGKDIRVSAPAGPMVTTLTGAGLGASVVTFRSGEPQTSGLDGFTITAGEGTPFWVVPEQLVYVLGAGILSQDGAQPTIRNCWIRDNHPQRFLGVGGTTYGGGACALVNRYFGVPGGAFPSDGFINLVNCVVEDNSSYHGGGTAGAVRLFEVTLRGNRATLGGGAYYYDSIRSCRIEENQAAHGGGIYRGFESLQDAPLPCSDEIRNCRFVRNTASGWGGGILYQDSSDRGPCHLQLTACTFQENSADRGGGAYLRIEVSCAECAPPKGPATLNIKNCIFTGNHATDESISVPPLDGKETDGAFLMALDGSGSTSSRVTLEHTTFHANSASAATHQLNAVNSIFWNTELPLDFQPVGEGSGASVEHCDVQGGYPGSGNLDVDPRFASPAMGDHHLRFDSPCIDAGVGQDRHDSEGDPCVGIADIGADEFHPHLYVLGETVPGGAVRTRVIGAPGTQVFHLASTTPRNPPAQTPAGELHVARPLLPESPMRLGVIPDSGVLAHSFQVPAETLPHTSIIHQAFLGNRAGGRLTNPDQVVVVRP